MIREGALSYLMTIHKPVDKACSWTLNKTPPIGQLFFCWSLHDHLYFLYPVVVVRPEISSNDRRGKLELLGAFVLGAPQPLPKNARLREELVNEIPPVYNVVGGRTALLTLGRKLLAAGPKKNKALTQKERRP